MTFLLGTHKIKPAIFRTVSQPISLLFCRQHFCPAFVLIKSILPEKRTVNAAFVHAAKTPLHNFYIINRSGSGFLKIKLELAFWFCDTP
jgi:hypothetical protein